MESDPLYEANTKIIQNTKSGLAEITGLKPDKIKIEKCYGISQKSDYAIFENAVLNTINKENISESLF